MRVLVSGAREWRSPQSIKDVLFDLYDLHDGKITVAQGGCRGVDQLTDMICDELHIYCKTYNADWDKHGRSAGIKRNIEMFNIEKPNLVLAFHRDLFGKSRGTLHMVQYAHEQGCEVRIYQKEY